MVDDQGLKTEEEREREREKVKALAPKRASQG